MAGDNPPNKGDEEEISPNKIPKALDKRDEEGEALELPEIDDSPSEPVLEQAADKPVGGEREAEEEAEKKAAAEEAAKKAKEKAEEALKPKEGPEKDAEKTDEQSKLVARGKQKPKPKIGAGAAGPALEIEDEEEEEEASIKARGKGGKPAPGAAGGTKKDEDEEKAKKDKEDDKLSWRNLGIRATEGVLMPLGKSIGGVATAAVGAIQYAMGDKEGGKKTINRGIDNIKDGLSGVGMAAKAVGLVVAGGVAAGLSPLYGIGLGGKKALEMIKRGPKPEPGPQGLEADQEKEKLKNAADALKDKKQEAEREGQEQQQERARANAISEAVSPPQSGAQGAAPLGQDNIVPFSPPQSKPESPSPQAEGLANVENNLKNLSQDAAAKLPPHSPSDNAGKGVEAVPGDNKQFAEIRDQQDHQVAAVKGVQGENGNLPAFEAQSQNADAQWHNKQNQIKDEANREAKHQAELVQQADVGQGNNASPSNPGRG